MNTGILFSLFLVGNSLAGSAQDKSPIQLFTKREKGIEVVQRDSLFSLRFQFRAQIRAGYFSTSETDFTPDEFEFRVRRLRMALRGFVISPKITYYIQLSFSRGDMDWSSASSTIYNTSPNIIRDAMAYYAPVPWLKFGLGQTKLPGNRQRVVSSGNLQFADRSIVNSNFTLDRDCGFFVTLESNRIRWKSAVTSGEGRNSIQSDKGLNYTSRLEFLPFGKFTGDNEDQEGDLVREPEPKLSFGATYNYNARAVRQAGTLGSDLYEPVNMQNLHLDLSFKFKGIALLSEYCNRIVNKDVTVDPSDSTSIRAVYHGFGSNTQLSYNFKNNFEIAFRYAFIVPDKNLYNNSTYSWLAYGRQNQYILGLSKYIYGHRLKLQGNFLYDQRVSMTSGGNSGNFGAIFQIEIGI